MIHFELPRRSARGNIRRIPTDVSGSRNVCVLMGAQREAAAPSRKCCAALGTKRIFMGKWTWPDAQRSSRNGRQATGDVQPNKRGRNSAEICPENRFDGARRATDLARLHFSSRAFSRNARRHVPITKSKQIAEKEERGLNER